MKTIDLIHEERTDAGFEIVSNKNNEVVFRKILLYEPSKKYEEKLPTVTLKSFTQKQLMELNEQKEELYKMLILLKEQEEKIKKHRNLPFDFVTAFKKFLME